MNIWIMNHYANSMFFDEGGRHYSFAKYLALKGNSVVVFCSNAQHGNGKEYFRMKRGVKWVLMNQKSINIPFVFVKSRSYEGNGKDRVFCMVDFYLNLMKTTKEYLKNNLKPDVIYASSVHPLTLLAGIKIARKLRIPCVCEVRDLWPESLIAYNIAGRRSLIVFLLRRLEKYIYEKADAVIFTMEGGYDYIKEQGWQKEIKRSKVFYINNGVDLVQFNENRKMFTLNDKDLDDTETYKIIYAGSIRNVNNVGAVLDIAKCHSNEKIKYLIWGDGDEKEKLCKRVEDEKITNVCFKGRVDKKYIPYITSKADLNFAHNGQSKMLLYGISFNKIFDYFAAGKPIVCDFDSNYNPAMQMQAGIEIKSGKPKEIARAIEILLCDNPELVKKMGQNAIKAAYCYDYQFLTMKLLKLLKKTIKEKRENKK